MDNIFWFLKCYRLLKLTNHHVLTVYISELREGREGRFADSFLAADPPAQGGKKRVGGGSVTCFYEIKNSWPLSIHWEAVQEQQSTENYPCGQLKTH